MSGKHAIHYQIDSISQFANALRQNDLVVASHILVNLSHERDGFTNDLRERLSQLEGVYLALVTAKLMSRTGAR